jgi:hypothetical protein
MHIAKETIQFAIKLPCADFISLFPISIKHACLVSIQHQLPLLYLVQLTFLSPIEYLPLQKVNRIAYEENGVYNFVEYVS